MLLGALLGAGVPAEVLQAAVDAVSPEPVAAVGRAGPARRAGRDPVPRGGRRVDHPPHLGRRPRAAGGGRPRTRAGRTFVQRLRAPRRRRGRRARHLARRGALPRGRRPRRDRRRGRGLRRARCTSGLDRLVVSPVAVGSGRVRAAHGSMPVPVPAVTELLRGVPSLAGPAAMESCTPTGAALLVTHASEWGAQPAMAVSQVGHRCRVAGPRDARQRGAAAGRASRPTCDGRRRAVAAGDQPRRPGPAAAAGGDRVAAGARRARRLADADHHEEGAAGPHAVGAGRRRPGRGRPRPGVRRDHDAGHPGDAGEPRDVRPVVRGDRDRRPPDPGEGRDLARAPGQRAAGVRRRRRRGRVRWGGPFVDVLAEATAASRPHEA